ncbi:MAG: sigma-70 family RNA polymerase sigma factor [Planctomycetes bacterium]|nr:sigma-70 family RNA polymerase sigma factor [Planctomycetota bacterium]
MSEPDDRLPDDIERPEPEPRERDFRDPPSWDEREDGAGETICQSQRRQDDPGETVLQGIRVKDGDADAWVPLGRKIERFLGDAFRHDRLTRRGIEFEDFQQEVLLELLRRLPAMELRSRGEFWAFVRKVARNWLIDQHRRQNADKRKPADGAVLPQDPDGEGRDLPNEVPDPAGGTGSRFARLREIEERELECVNRVLVDDEQRRIYLLRRRDELSHDEIAAKVGRNKGATVRLIFHRAQKKVIACLRDRLDGYESMI